MARKKTHEKYVTEVTEINPNIEVVGFYTYAKIKILHRCKIDRYEWEATPNNILRGQGCPKCAGNKKMTHEEYVSRLFKINQNIKVIGRYMNSQTRVLHKCLADGYEWYILPNNALQGYGCPKCANTVTKTHEEYETQIKETRNDIIVIEKYINAKTPILHKCNICEHIWKAKPTNIISGHQGCPVCCGNIVGNPPEYKNSVWSSEYREYFSKYLTKAQMKSIMPHSNKKIEIKCPDCGKVKMIAPNTLIYSGLGCTCGDGQSYPNKFMYALLNQLDNIEYNTEYSPTWSHKKRYDIFIIGKNCIIENHGMQHYNGWCNNKSDLKKQQENDNLKKKLALKNGIINYITIDCRYSNTEWIKRSIMASDLPRILGFTEEEINWVECGEYAQTNRVKELCKYYNNHKLITIKDLAKTFNIHVDTVRRYLNNGELYGWCNYSVDKQTN